ncbi:MAG: hypothetical protein M1831_007060 [Alyxoria varia]|nr:MAG: hypothetical protein M1831_007060 [Alyxoria varia]
MATLQLTFTLRTSPNCKTVHLLGNWDGYKGQLPLSKDSSKSGAWKGTFRFSGSTLKQGQRYWYYYIVDGYHVSHDPAQSSTTEPTTGRKLNILDVPSAKPGLSVDTRTPAPRASGSNRDTRRTSTADVVHGRGVSPSKIVSPRPTRPKETKNITQARYSRHSPDDIDALSGRMAKTKVSSSSFSDESSEASSDSEIDSDVSSDMPSLSSGSSRGSPSSLRSPASPTGSACSCECWGVNRKGDRVKLDCGGSRCSSSGDSDSEADYYRTKLDHSRGSSRRQGVVVRDSGRDSRRYRR